jgi:hypothetical protein
LGYIFFKSNPRRAKYTKNKEKNIIEKIKRLKQEENTINRTTG